MITIKQLKKQGFDLSTSTKKYKRVRCSCCSALVINGVPCHEMGCPNWRRKR